MPGFLTEVEGFTPVIDAIVQDVGLMGAVVYGVMWRYFQMQDNVCKASLQQIANRIGIDRSTVLRHAKSLCREGYIIDLTPQVRNRPHVYADAGRAKIQGILEARRVAQNNRVLHRTTECCTEQQSVAESNATVAESQLKRVSKKASKTHSKEILTPPAATAPPSEPKSKRKPSPKQQEAQAMFSALASICQIDLVTITGTQRKQLNQSGLRLREAKAIPADMEPFATWWYANDWRGKKGDAPRPAQVRETWGQFKSWREGGQNYGKRTQSTDPRAPNYRPPILNLNA